MRVGLHNVNSIRAHIEQIRQFLDRKSYHLFGVAETWLGPTVDDHLVRVDGYSLVRQDRNINGGGVALFVRNTLKVKVLETSNTTGPGKPGTPEFLMCCVQEGDYPPVFVAVIYRPPKIPFFKDTHMTDSLRDLCDEYSHKVIMGDLNADLLVDSADARTVRQLADDLSLRLVQHGSTHHTTSSGTWIDIILVDDNDTILDQNNDLMTYRSGHNVIDVSIKYEISDPLVSEFTYRDYKSVTSESLVNTLLNCDWSEFHRQDFNIDDGLNCLSSNLTRGIDILAPLKIIKPRKKRLPWIGAELRLLINKRDATKRRYKRTRSAALLEEFRRLCDEVEVLTEQARVSFMHDQLSAALDEGKDMWREMRNLGLLPQTREELHGFSPEVLNTHFASVSVSPGEECGIMDDTVDSAGDEGFTFKPVDLSDVILAVSHFSSQARGVDDLPHKVVAKALPIIGPYLVRLFNASLSEGIFPSAWKRAQLVAIKKTSTPSSPSDFRPIALLCFLSKVLEKLAHVQITEYLEAGSIPDPLQTGFRQHHSTQTALLKLTDDIRIGIDRRMVTLLLLFDFSKAFDTISPSKLLSKLRGLGFSRLALSWIKSYLTGRVQRVATREHGHSEWLETNLGVPQGSVLGPLLFTLYINDLKDIFDDQSIKHILYADDLQIYLQVPVDKILEGIAKLADAARCVSRWAERSRLRLNAGKTKAIFFGSKKYVNMLNEQGMPSVDMGEGTLVPFSDTVVSLGVALDSKLTWKEHVTAVKNKVRRALYSLRFIRPCTTETIRKRLVEALVIPHLDYCTVVCLDASVKLKGLLQRLSNSCVRYIMGVRRDEHITPFRRHLGWMLVATRRDYFACLLMYKILRLKQPPYLAEFFKNNDSTRCSSRGDVKELSIPHVRLETGVRAFHVHYAHVWNALPATLRNLPSYSYFKMAIRTHYERELES